MKRKVAVRARVELFPHGRHKHPEITEGEADCEMDVGDDGRIEQIRRTGPIEPLNSASTGAASNAYRSGWDAVFGSRKPRAKA